MNKAVFIDRDGVINPLVYYADHQGWESPRTPEEFEMYPYVPEALQKLKQAGYFLFVVSNQPSYAKGKMTRDNVMAIEKKLDDMSAVHGRLFEECYYCYHHPQAVVPGYAVKCVCRKPGTLFPTQAIIEYELDSTRCYFIGDRDSDILCGLTMGFQTVRIRNQHYIHNSGDAKPDYTAKDLAEAVKLILAPNH